LAQRDYRRVLAACQEEALAVYAALHVKPARLTPISPAATIRMLRSPDPVFRVAARTSLRVDPAARSSMADDLTAGRSTEIAELQGEVARLGRAHGIPTPACDAVCRLVGEAERAGPGGSRQWSGRDLLHEVTGARRG
ncbi:MAG: ketopantoate reductase C-terminal domain-containing protein, partial [Nostocoides sp.]